MIKKSIWITKPLKITESDNEMIGSSTTADSKEKLKTELLDSINKNKNALEKAARILLDNMPTSKSSQNSVCFMWTLNDSWENTLLVGVGI